MRDWPDYEKRLALVKSWLGQLNFVRAKAIVRAQRRLDTNRRTKRDQNLAIEHWENLGNAWEEKIDRCLRGDPLDEIMGKLKVATSMPPSTKHSARYALHQERLAKKRARRKRAREREANKEN